MRRFSLNWLLIAVNIFALVLAACGPTPTEPPAPTEAPTEAPPAETPTAPPPAVEVEDEWGVVTVAAGDPIKIGFAAGLSGAGIDVLGLDEQRGAELAVKDKPEVLGFPVELQVEDAQCNAEGGQTVATKFVADPQIVALVGHMCSSSCTPSSKVYEQNYYTMVSPSCTAPSLTNPDLDGTAAFFRTCWNDKIQGPAAAKFVYETLGVTKVATIHDGSPYAEQLGQEFTAGFEALGGEVVAAEAVNVGDTDMRPVLTRIKAAEPELLYFSAFVAEGGYLRSQMADVGMEEVLFMGADGIKADEFIKAAGDAAEGVYASAGNPAEAGPDLPKFLEAYEAEYGEAPIAPFHAQAYDAYMVIANAIEQVGVVDADGNLMIGRKALNDAIRGTMGYQGLSGMITCDENGDCAEGTVSVSMVQGGAWVAAEAPAAAAPAPPGPEEELNFILVQHALCAWDSFWCTVEQGITDAAEDMGVNVTVLGPDEFNLEKTATLIDQAVAAQPDGIALTVTDPVLFKEPIMRAIDAGIPVLAYNAGSGPVVDGIPYMAYLGQDEYQGGYLGGLRLAAEGGTKGVCINQQVGHTGLDARCQGFIDALDEKGIPAEVLAIGDDLAESQTIIDDYFTANPDVDIALTLGPNGATPFYAFLDAAGLGPEDVTHGTFDLNDEIRAAIENGTSMFGIDQQPYMQGYGAVMWLAMVNRYGITPAMPVMATGPGFVDASNVGAVPDPDKEVNLMLVQHALCAWDSFWCVVEKGIQTAAEQMGVNVTVLGPDEFNLEKTATLIDQAVAAQPDGIALTVTDPVLFKEPIMRAIDAGIPVLAYNAGSGPLKDDIPYLTYLGQDEYQGGYQGGLRLAAEGGTKGVCINQQVGHTGLDARCQGFVDALAEKGLEAEVLAIGDDLAESQTIIDDYFTANPDVDIALTLGPNGATPFYAFLDAAGLGPEDVTHGTFDLNPEIVAAIENGTSMFGIDQQPFLQGYGAVMMLTLLNRQNIVPALPVTPTGPGFVDQSNVAIVKALAGEYR